MTGRVWTVVGFDPPDDDDAGVDAPVYATEDAAWAAFGRAAGRAGAVGDAEVVERPVVGEQPIARPPWLGDGEVYASGPNVYWDGAGDGDEEGFSCETSGLTGRQDRAMAAYVAALINAHRREAQG